MKNHAALLATLATLLLSPVTGLLAADAPAASPSPAPSPAASGSTPALDFGDFGSATIVGKAWKALEAKDYDSVIGYTGKVIDMFQKQALDQQKSLTAPVPGDDKAKVFAMWALNDVGTAYYIRGQAYEKSGKTKEALDAYKFLADNLAFAQTYDPKGWFWKPAGAAAERVKVLEFDSVK